MTAPAPRRTSFRPDVERFIVRWPEDRARGRRTLEMAAARIFRPFTLLLWGTELSSFVHGITTPTSEPLISPTPAHLFEADIPFEDFEKLLLERPDGHHAVSHMPPIGLYFPMDMTMLRIGERLRVDIEGPFLHGVFLGYGSTLAMVAGSPEKPLTAAEARAIIRGEKQEPPPGFEQQELPEPPEPTEAA